MKNKKIVRRANKGSVNLLIENLVNIIFAMIAVVTFVLLVGLFISNKSDTRFLQAETFKYRILYSDAIMYQDPVTYRIYPGIVDMNKLNNDLDDRIDYKSFPRHVAAKIKILDIPKKAFGDGELRKETYYNKEHFFNLQKLIQAKIPGKESGIMFISTFPSSCRYNENDYKFCTLIIEVIVPNT